MLRILALLAHNMHIHMIMKRYNAIHTNDWNEMNNTTNNNKIDAIIKRYANDKKRIIHQIQFAFNCTSTRAIDMYNARIRNA